MPSSSQTSPATPTSESDKVAEHFNFDASRLGLLVQREDGPFRYLLFASPKTSLNRIELITWPHNLLVAGSHGSFHFNHFAEDARDMFEWIRGRGEGLVKPDHWASKLVNGRDSVAEYDRSLLEKEINERVAEAVSDGWAPKGLEAAVREEILDSHWLDEEQNALRIVNEFQHGLKFRAECSCSAASQDYDSYGLALLWEDRVHTVEGDDHKIRVRQVEGFDFDETYEWNIHGLDYHYLWQCHAIVWGIARYDKVASYGLSALAAPKAVAA